MSYISGSIAALVLYLIPCILDALPQLIYLEKREVGLEHYFHYL